MPEFKTGDVVGCGINYFKKEIFFTHNGKYNGTAAFDLLALIYQIGPSFTDVELLEYYATVSLQSKNELITFNFGGKAFRYDFASYLKHQMSKMFSEILT